MVIILTFEIKFKRTTCIFSIHIYIIGKFITNSADVANRTQSSVLEIRVL